MVAIFPPFNIMSLNIKDPETHELAAALAKATGESMTKAVTLAIQERLERIKNQRRASPTELRAIGLRCAENLTSRPADHGELLYDEQGLPK
jgi:antitoxin VapB